MLFDLEQLHDYMESPYFCSMQDLRRLPSVLHTHRLIYLVYDGKHIIISAFLNCLQTPTIPPDTSFPPQAAFDAACDRRVSSSAHVLQETSSSSASAA